MATAVLPDQALLQRFVDRRDEGAFTELLRRHGTMVRATCLRYLGDTPEADDAFQAVFLVLVRKADRILKRDLLGPWLHTVAVRASQKVLTAKRRRQTRERSVDPLPEPAARDSQQPQYRLSLLDDAVQSLPGKYRVPLLLCDLQGLSREEAAERLALPAGTVSSRVARGRRLLRERLLRRGLSVSVAALVMAALAGGLANKAAAAVPPELARATTTAALTGRASETAATLADRTLRSLFLSKLKLLLAPATAIFLLVAGGSCLVCRQSHPDVPAENKPKPDHELLQGTWRGLSGRMAGNDVDAAALEKIRMGRWVFKGDRLENMVPCDVRLDPDKVPKHIDMTAHANGQMFLGYYELQGDRLRIRLGNLGAPRPVDFDDDAGMLFVLTRAKE